MPCLPLFCLRGSPDPSPPDPISNSPSLSNFFPDHITYSPSLDFIFSFLDIEDIVHCQLVSRRFNQLILRDSKKLRKITLEIVATNYRGIDQIEIKPCVKKSEYASPIYITNQRIRISKKELPYFCYHYTQTAKKLEKIIDPKSHRYQVREDRMSECEGYQRWCDFEVDGINGGLRTFLTNIFSRFGYRLKSLKLSDYFPFSAALLEALKELNVKCDTMLHGPDLALRDDIYNALGCTHVEVQKFAHVKELLKSTNQFVKCPFNINNIKVDMIMDLVTEWTERKLRINYLYMYEPGKRVYGKRHREIYDTTFTELISKMRLKDNVAMSYDETAKDLQIVLSRLGDNTVLRVHVSSLRGTVAMYESDNMELPIVPLKAVKENFARTPYYAWVTPYTYL